MFHKSKPLFGTTLLFDDLWKGVVKSSGSGAPYFRKKGLLMDECKSIHTSILEKRFDEHVLTMPNVIYQVVQASKSGKYKRRLVYCPPFAVTVLELYFGLTVAKFFVGNKFTSIVTGHRQMYLYNLNQSLGPFYKFSGDYSSYDQTIPSFLIKVSFEIIKYFYNFNNSYEEELYNKMVDYIMFGHIYHPEVGFIHRKRGISSGSVFTNLIDSIVNLLMVNYSFSVMNKEYRYLYVCGDDNLICSDNKLNYLNMSSIITKKFNVSIQIDSQSVYDKGVRKMLFLGSYWSDDGPRRYVKRMILSAVKRSWN